MKYDYETIGENGSKYGFVIKGNQIVVYVNNIEWGVPQGSRIIKALLNDIMNKKKYKVIAWCNDCEPNEFTVEYSASSVREVEKLFFRDYDESSCRIDDIIEEVNWN